MKSILFQIVHERRGNPRSFSYFFRIFSFSFVTRVFFFLEKMKSIWFQEVHERGGDPGGHPVLAVHPAPDAAAAHLSRHHLHHPPRHQYYPGEC